MFNITRCSKHGVGSQNPLSMPRELTNDVKAIKLLDKARSTCRALDTIRVDTLIDLDRIEDVDAPDLSSEEYRQVYQELSSRISERTELSKLLKKINERIKNNESRIKLLEWALGLTDMDQLKGPEANPSSPIEVIFRNNSSNIGKQSSNGNVLHTFSSPNLYSELGFVSQDTRQLQKLPAGKQMVVISIPKNISNVEKAATFMKGFFEEIGHFQCFISDKNDIEKVDSDGNLVNDGAKAISRWMWEFQQMLNRLCKLKPMCTILFFSQGYEFKTCKSQLWEMNELVKRRLLSCTRLIVFDGERSIEGQMVTLWRTKESYLTLGYPLEFFSLEKWEGSAALWTRMKMFFRTTDFRVGDQVEALHHSATGWHRGIVRRVHSGNREFDIDYNDAITLQEIWGPRAGLRLKCPRQDIRPKDINALIGLACSQPMIYAVRNNLQVTIKYLLKWEKTESDTSSSGVNCRDMFGNTPLHIACHAGNIWVVRLLLNSKANPSVKNDKDMTCLVLAAAQGFKVIVELLISKAGCTSVAEIKSNLNQALLLSAERDHLTTAASLVKNKADVNVADKESRSPLILASREGHEQMCKYLVTLNAKIEYSDIHGQTPLIWATAEGKLEVIEVLLEADANVDAQDNDGQTPLMWAASEDNDEICEVLLEYGANPMKVDTHFGRNCLMRAAIESNLNIIATLLEYKADLEDRDNDGRTAFMLATEFAHKSIVLALLDMKANVNAEDNNGRTALVESAKSGKFDAVALLLNANADVTKRDKFGWTALMWAAKRGFVEIMECLIKATPEQVNAEIRGVTVLMRAAAEGHSDAVKLLLRSNADCKKHDRSRSRTALMKAAQGGHEDTVRVLLMAGADATDTDYNHDTATVIARKKGYLNVAEVLEQYRKTQIKKGLNTTPIKKNNITPVINVQKILPNYQLSKLASGLRSSFQQVSSNSE